MVLYKTDSYDVTEILLKDLDLYLKNWLIVVSKTRPGSKIMKKSLNNGGHKFHQHQQKEQSTLIWTHWTQIKITTYEVGTTGIYWGKHNRY